MTEGNNIPEGETAGVDETPAGSESAKEKRPEEEKEGTEDKETWDSKLDIPEKNDAKEEVEFVHPEGGWGWVVMLASMWCNGSVFGIQNNFGVIYVYLLEEFASKETDSEYDKDLKFRACEYRLTWVGV